MVATSFIVRITSSHCESNTASRIFTAIVVGLVVFLAGCGINTDERTADSEFVIDTGATASEVHLLDDGGVEMASVAGPIEPAAAGAGPRRFRVTSGAYEVRIVADGHVPFVGRYTVLPGSTIRLTVDLPQADGVDVSDVNLAVITSPSTADVVLAGDGAVHRFATAEIERGDSSELDVRFGAAPGPYRLSITAPGLGTNEQDVVLDDSSQTITDVLPPTGESELGPMPEPMPEPMPDPTIDPLPAPMPTPEFEPAPEPAMPVLGTF